MSTVSAPLRNALKHGRYAKGGPAPLAEVQPARLEASIERFGEEFLPHAQVDTGVLFGLVDAWHERERAQAAFLQELRHACAGLREVDAGAGPEVLLAALQKTTRFLETNLRLLVRHAGYMEDALYLARVAQRRAARRQAA